MEADLNQEKADEILNMQRLHNFSIEIGQSAKGLWYCKSCKIREDISEELEKKLNDALILIQKKLNELNV